MESLWHATNTPPVFSNLERDLKTDVLIIGGGIAGILTAYFLQKKGIQYTLVEKDRICGGITGNTTAKITVQHGLLYQKIEKQYGLDAAEGYFQIQKQALNKFAELGKSINCDFEHKDNFVYSTNDRRKIETELHVLQKIGASARYVNKLPLPISTVGAVKIPDQAQFHPLKFLSAIAKGLNIYENTFVREMIGNTAVTDGGKIKADTVIDTTHFPFINKHGLYFLKLYQHRSYVIALENAPDVQGMYVDECKTGFSFRNTGRLLLLGGGGHRTGKTGGNWAELRSFAQTHYRGAVEKYFWAAQDCMTLDGIPYIGQYSKSTPNFYVATGFNKWGMTGSMAAAMMLSDLVIGRKNKFAKIFDPSRTILKPQLLVNGWETTVNLLTPTKKRCPHLGCALKWNAAEHSWDCPCHGSRFAKDGTVLNNPANDSLHPDPDKPH